MKGPRAHIEGAEEREDDGHNVYDGGDCPNGIKHHLQLAHGAHQKGGAAGRRETRGGRSAASA
jgi:hypothetical protein